MTTPAVRPIAMEAQRNIARAGLGELAAKRPDMAEHCARMLAEIDAAEAEETRRELSAAK